MMSVTNTTKKVRAGDPPSMNVMAHKGLVPEPEVLSNHRARFAPLLELKLSER